MNPVKNIIETGAGIVGGAARQGQGLLRKAQNLRPSPKPDMTDETLKSKVESEVFRAPGVTRGDVNVTVVDRKVTLHGKAKNPAAVKAIETAVNGVPEVIAVENRLAIKGSTSRKKPATRQTPRRTGQKVNREVKSASRKEPSPTKLAEQGKGRQPAPLGASEGATTGSADVNTPGAKVEAALTAKEAGRGSTKTGAASAGTSTRTGAAKTATKSATGSTKP